MASLGFLFSIFALFFTASILISPSSSEIPSNEVALFLFGDGDYDVGNYGEKNKDSRYRHYPYGKTCFNTPTGRPSDGRLVVDFIAKKLGLDGYVEAYYKETRYSWHNGAGFAIIDASVYENEKHPVSLQLSLFENVVSYLEEHFGKNHTDNLIRNSIYLFTLGADDYVNHVGSAFQNFEGVGKTSQNLIRNYIDLIRGIYAKGGRKFGFQNIGPLSVSPCFKNKEPKNGTIPCFSDLKDGPAWVNAVLKQELMDLKSNCEDDLPAFKYAYFDYYHFVSKLNAESQHVSEACCGSGKYNGELTCGSHAGITCSDPENYVWFDGIHLTDSANQKAAEAFWEGTEDVGPYNLKQLADDKISIASRTATLNVKMASA